MLGVALCRHTNAATPESQQKAIDMYHIDSNIERYDPIFSPKELLAQLPANDRVVRTVVDSRTRIQLILSGKSDRIMLIVGPCSIHDPDDALQYAQKLHSLSRKVDDTFLILLRAYFEK
ncbi:MAG: hypothetical protein OEM41_09135, partial [Ignavibacteria bacterium]|nr:hypothetical protein [Ignavibacteria bacterium]